jgi:hypothetical protein
MGLRPILDRHGAPAASPKSGRDEEMVADRPNKEISHEAGSGLTDIAPYKAPTQRLASHFLLKGRVI